MTEVLTSIVSGRTINKEKADMLKEIKIFKVLCVITFVIGNMVWWEISDIKMQRNLNEIRTYCTQKYGLGVGGDYNLADDGVLKPVCITKTGVYWAGI